jgi:hypothetical protein
MTKRKIEVDLPVTLEEGYSKKKKTRENTPALTLEYKYSPLNSFNDFNLMQTLSETMSLFLQTKNKAVKLFICVAIAIQDFQSVNPKGSNDKMTMLVEYDNPQSLFVGIDDKYVEPPAEEKSKPLSGEHLKSVWTFKLPNSLLYAKILPVGEVKAAICQTAELKFSR